MADLKANQHAKLRILDAIDAYRGDDLHSLKSLIALLDNQRQSLGNMSEEWLKKYEHHVRVLDEIYALTQQSRWSRFGKRRRKTIQDEVNALRSLLESGP
jgi:hypothetical protein